MGDSALLVQEFDTYSHQVQQYIEDGEQAAKLLLPLLFYSHTDYPPRGRSTTPLGGGLQGCTTFPKNKKKNLEFFLTASYCATRADYSIFIQSPEPSNQNFQISLFERFNPAFVGFFISHLKYFCF